MEIYKEIVKICNELAKKKIIKVSTLGKIENYKLILVEIKKKSKINGLITAGFHGNENAPCFAILEFLKNIDDYLPLIKFNLFIIPAVNLTGLKLNRRNDKWGRNPNRGFVHRLSPLSPEGKIIKEWVIKRKTKFDAFISLHEDPREYRFYVYTFERNYKPGKFSFILRNTGAKFFEIKNDEEAENGIDFFDCDGSFEDFLFFLGTPFTACTETPGKEDFNLRIKANLALIKSFIRFLNNFDKNLANSIYNKSK
jgi:hypothetical protein